MNKPILRKCLLVDEWVIIAPERGARPRQLELVEQSTEDSFCPFCPENEAVTPPPIQQWASPSFPDAPWGVRAIPNKFPALQIEEFPSPDSDSLYQTSGGIGAHEVIIESPEHHLGWEEFSPKHRGQVLLAWQDRMRDLRKDKRLRAAVVFKNHGAPAGATLSHVHSQLIALPFVPARLDKKVRGAKHFHQTHGRCALCAMIEREVESGERIVVHNDHAVALAPFGSRLPFEIWILPRNHQADFASASHAVLQSVADLASQILPLWHQALGSTNHNLVLHSIPFDFAGEPYYHWHLEMLPRIGQVAGFEWGSDFYINATASEVAARYLRHLAN